MRSSTSVAVACLAASVSAHGVVTKVTGANGVEMPGLTGKFYPLDFTIPVSTHEDSG